jgi:hypothetical protein
MTSPWARCEWGFAAYMHDYAVSAADQPGFGSFDLMLVHEFVQHLHFDSAHNANRLRIYLTTLHRKDILAQPSACLMDLSCY